MSRFFALVPAAGTGSRFGHDVPKQYLPIAGRPMLAHSVGALAAHPAIERVCVVLAPGDTRYHDIDFGPARAKVEPLFCGGPARASTVYNGLIAIADDAEGDDWVLVHDAARPCLSRAQLDALVGHVGEDETGGILAVPVADTLKRSGADGRIEATVPREHLWQAQTPQMFRYGLLREALSRSRTVTDEAGAVEALGYRPLLVASDTSNLKVTYPADMALAENILLERKGA